MSDDLDRQTYFKILRFFLTLYKAAEGQRETLALWQDLSLAPAVRALEKDLADRAASSQGQPLYWVVSPATCIGMLYVLHGASIGGKLIARNLARVLPDEPREFFGRGLKPELWQGVVDALETYQGKSDDYDQILHSATCTFDAFNRRIAAASLG